MRRRLTVSEKIWGMLTIFALGLATLSALDLYSTRDVLITEKKLKTRHLVEAAHSVASHFQSLQQEGVLNFSEAQQAALKIINSMRYQDTEYFWINDLSVPIPRMVMHPALPELNGQVLDSKEFNCATSMQFGNDGPVVKTAGEKNLFVAFNEVVNKSAAGYVTYLWPKPLLSGGATQERYPKLSYVKKFDAWGWVIGSGIYIDDVGQVIQERIFKDLSIVFGIAGSLVLIGGVLARNISRRLSQGANALNAMTQGDTPLAPLPVGENDEIGTLISGFNQMQAALLAKEDSLRLSASVFENTNEGIFITDPKGKILSVNPSFTQLTGYAEASVIGKGSNILKSDQESPKLFEQMWETIKNEGFWQGEITNRRMDGEIFIATLAINAVRNAEGELSHYVGIFSDITKEKRQQQKLEHMAHFDALTQLPNRVLLADRLKLALKNAQRMKEIVAVVFLDLDEFKPVNDKYGHSAGDSLLIEVAHRLLKCVRGNDTVARLGGDEFVMLLVGLKETQEVGQALDRVLTTLSQPYLLGGEKIAISASIGVTLSSDDSANSEVLLRHADQAMYEAKQYGRNCYRFFDAEHDRITRTHNQRLIEIREALANKEFILYYQPKVDLRLGRVIGFEALIRWKHPEEGLLLPGVFLPDVENHELEIAIGDWVIESALSQLEQWQPLGQSIPVSVNVSAAQLEASDFVSKLRIAKDRHPSVARFSLEIEILETTALSDYEYISRVIEECLNLGVSFAIDDFGTGYSSLSYVKRLPVNTLKIDKSFVIDMLEQPDDQAIIEGIVGFTRAFQREVIAEGVESGEHGAMLLHLGCEQAQGFGIARPMPPEEVAVWISRFKPDPLWGGDSYTSDMDYPLLRAEKNHCSWVDRIHELANDHGQNNRKPPPLNPHHCSFGRWLDGPGRDAYGKLPRYERIDAIHRKVHDLGEIIVEMVKSHDDSGVDTFLAELDKSHTTLILELRGLRALNKQ